MKLSRFLGATVALACDVTMAELTGLCLTPATGPLPSRIAAALAPDLDISCTATRPSPPG